MSVQKRVTRAFFANQQLTPPYLIYFTTTITNEIINLSKKVVPRIEAEERGSRRVLFFQVEPFSHGSLASNF